MIVKKIKDPDSAITRIQILNQNSNIIKTEKQAEDKNIMLSGWQYIMILLYAMKKE